MLLRPREFTEAAFELITCCKKAFPAPDLLESSGEDEDEDDDAAPAVMDVLVDTLLSLLPQSSAPMRTAIEQVRYLWAKFLGFLSSFPSDFSCICNLNRF